MPFRKGALFYGETRMADVMPFSAELREEVRRCWKRCTSSTIGDTTLKVRRSKSCNACSPPGTLPARTTEGERCGHPYLRQAMEVEP